MRRLLLALAAALLVGATGCGAIRDTIRTENALHRAGFRDASVSWYSEGGVEIVEIWWTAQAETYDTLSDESLRAAGVVWRVAPIRFDVVETYPDTPYLVPPTNQQRAYSRVDLQHAFGPRPPGLDRSLSEVLGVRHYVRWAILGITSFLLSSALVVWLVLRSSRKGRAAAA